MTIFDIYEYTENKLCHVTTRKSRTNEKWVTITGAYWCRFWDFIDRWSRDI